ncbi:allantoicase [Mycolicibacterium tokaiense]|nr:allantoicase [Mycolicibacterium tokaiense]BBY84371.1 putative allantoicase [Mycolicibacterium tokaiense]
MSTPAPHLPDLAARLLGGTVMAASDEAFGEKENLLNPEPVNFVPGSFGPRGEIVDGWETRRRRTEGDDWALIRLGTPGLIRSIDVDTTSFTGNHPVGCRVEACGVEGYPGPGDLLDADWQRIVDDSPLASDQSNVFAVHNDTRFTHVRLTVWPDGGVGRLRIHGEPVTDPRDLDLGTVDLASPHYGAAITDSSDGFYSPARSLNRPDMARTMGDGWETRRNRDRGPDWVLFQLATRARVHALVIDTAYFRYNASAAVIVESSDHHQDSEWVELLARTDLQPDTRHVFRFTDAGAELPVATHLRLHALPDGGLSRVRVVGSATRDGRWQVAHRWWNTLPESQAVAVLRAAGVEVAAAAHLAAARPVLDPADLDGDPAAGEVLHRILTGSADATEHR